MLFKALFLIDFLALLFAKVKWGWIGSYTRRCLCDVSMYELGSQDNKLDLHRICSRAGRQILGKTTIISIPMLFTTMV